MQSSSLPLVSSASALLHDGAMVFLQNVGSSEKMFKGSEDGCKKRKLECRNPTWNFEWDGTCINDGTKLNNSNLGVELHLKSPLPPEWEQCLDLQDDHNIQGVQLEANYHSVLAQSGQIYYVNRSTQRKTWQDPRQGENLNQLSKNLRLDLELNLPFVSKNYQHENDHGRRQESGIKTKFPPADSSSPFLEESSNSSDEMIAIACMQCHMFVMMCKASPLCPNCKYMHPMDNTSIALKKDITPVRQTLSLLDFGVHGGLEPKLKHKKDG